MTVTNLPDGGVDGPFFVKESLRDTEAAAAANYEVFFIADRPYELVEAYEAHRVLGTDVGAVSLTVEKLTGTQALGAGVEMLASAWDLKAIINTVVTKAFTTTAANKKLAKGDRMALKDTGVLTAVAGIVVVVKLKAVD